jgi:hypothetical protein
VAFNNVKIDFSGLGSWMRSSDALAAALLAHAEVGVAYAKSIAPVGPDRDPHRGEFRDSIHASVSALQGGHPAARIYANPLWPEFGRKHREPYEGAHTLRQVAAYLNSPERSA